MTDLNYFFFRRHQELLRAEVARCPEARDAHRMLADLFQDRIVAARTELSRLFGTGPIADTSQAVIAHWALKH